MNPLAAEAFSGNLTDRRGSYREHAIVEHPIIRQVWIRESAHMAGSPVFNVARTAWSVVAHVSGESVEVEHRAAGQLTERPLSPVAVGFVAHPWVDQAAQSQLHDAVERVRAMLGDRADRRAAIRLLVERCRDHTADGGIRAAVLALEELPSRGIQRDIRSREHRSERTMRRRFRAAVGMSADRFRVVSRVAAARRILVESDDDLVVVACRLGFSDQAHMHRDFAALCGYTPSEWRARRTAWAVASDGRRESDDSRGINQRPRRR